MRTKMKTAMTAAVLALAVRPQAASAQRRSPASAAPLHCLQAVRGWPSFLDEERALFLCGGAPTAQGPAACFSSARAWPSSLSDERAMSLCRGALEAEAPLACLGRARAWPYGLGEEDSVALCRAARSAKAPVDCFAEARQLLGDEAAIELCAASPRPAR